MFKIAKPFFIHTITSLHCGSGNDLGIVDLPIQREKHTSFPKIESSSLKGGLRESFENNKEDKKKKLLEEKLKKFNDDKELLMIDFQNSIDQTKKIIFNYDYAVHLAFGFDKDDLRGYDKDTNEKIRKSFGDDTEFSGCLGFTDARLLFFPVKSVKDVFAWITCPYVLNRFKEDMNLTKKDNEPKITFIKPEITVDEKSCLVSTQNKVSIKNNKGDSISVILEEYSFNLKPLNRDEANFSEIIKTINGYYSVPNLEEKLVIISDDDFKDFVNLSTEVITRTKIDNATGTVKGGALFNEEYLPPETILYYLVFASPVFQKDDNKKGIFKKNGKAEEELVFEFFKSGLPEYLQLGGNATIGKGIVRTKLMEV